MAGVRGDGVCMKRVHGKGLQLLLVLSMLMMMIIKRRRNTLYGGPEGNMGRERELLKSR